jgi:hypothetical protein
VEARRKRGKEEKSRKKAAKKIFILAATEEPKENAKRKGVDDGRCLRVWVDRAQ